MSIYRFSNDSPISTITFHYEDGVPTVALIEASKTATAEQISAASKALSGAGMSLLPVTVDERDMLQVSDFLTEQAVIDALLAKHIVNGSLEIVKDASDFVVPQHHKFQTFLDNYSLKMAGTLNLVGDIMMHLGGYSKVTAKFDKTTNKPFTPAQRKASVVAGSYDLAGGGLYTVGGLNAAVFGNSKIQAPPLTERTADFIADTVNPQGSALESPKKMGHFLHRHTADVTLGAYTLGAGVFLAQGLSGYREMSKKLLGADAAKSATIIRDRKESASLIAYGTSSLVFKLLSLCIKEKPKSEEDKPKSNNPVIRVKDWFVEKPMRIFGLSCFVNDTFYAKHAYDTYKRVKGTPNSKSSSEYIFKIITTLSYFGADFFSTVSSKNLLIKPLNADEERGVIAKAAESIAQQPQEKRDVLVSRTVDFLSKQPEVQHRNKKIIAASLTSHIKHMDSNPWAKWVETQEPVLPKQR